jgi:hypothetical protein
MNESNPRIETAGGDSQSTFVLCQSKAIVQNGVRGIDRETWLTRKRGVPSAESQPVIRHPVGVSPWERDWNVPPDRPIPCSGLRFESANHIQTIGIGQSFSKLSNERGDGGLLQLLAQHSLLSFELRSD